MILDNNTNIRQRGITNTNQIKFGRCIEELKRLYGIKNGGDRKSEKIRSGNSSSDPNVPKNLKELAEHLGVGIDQIKLATRLNSLPPEVLQLVEDGKITSSTAVRVLGTLSAGALRNWSGSMVFLVEDLRKKN